jgi:hypothetical protein
MTFMEKLDLTKTDKAYFTAKKTPHVVDINAARFLSLRGKGDPSDKEFTDNLEALYPVVYMIKFAFKAKEEDFVVSKLEGLWWYDEDRYKGKTIDTAVEIPRSDWEYRLLIRLPDFVTKKDVETAVKSVIEKKNNQRASKVEYFEMTEGKCVQMMHIGPFSDERVSLKIMDEFMKTNDFKRNGAHHEIYLSDYRKTEAAKLKTILREPVK